jgi:hypothetical protein
LAEIRAWVVTLQQRRIKARLRRNRFHSVIRPKRVRNKQPVFRRNRAAPTRTCHRHLQNRTHGYISGVIAIIRLQRLGRGQIRVVRLRHRHVRVPGDSRVIKHVTQILSIDAVARERNIDSYILLNASCLCWVSSACCSLRLYQGQIAEPSL